MLNILSCTNSSPLLLTTAGAVAVSGASNKVNKVNWTTMPTTTTRTATVMLTAAAEPASHQLSQLDIDLTKSQPMLLFHHQQKKPDIISQALLKGVL